ncbi:siderophore-interacting protein [Aestuariimicrobium soli]|uniref:siderophore-interacting protein n=1 Tax=Aestuariimicrobium soli TaxID=2035834 RepID=UPI003EB986C6
MYAEVISSHQLTPDLWRVVLGGPGLDEFSPSEFADSYVNCFFVPEGAPYTVPFDTDETRDLPREQRPFPRRYTVRAWDPDTRQLTLDFVAHGEVGFAGRWARGARPGDLLQLRGPGGEYNPHADADAYLFVGDESALPAIAVACERVPAGRPVTVVVEVENAAGQIELASPGALTVVWVHREGADDPDSLLATAVAALPAPTGRVSAFVHGEAMETRLVRREVLANGRVDPDWLSCSPYWRRGLDDEQWRSIKKDFVRETQAEVV